MSNLSNLPVLNATTPFAYPSPVIDFNEKKKWEEAQKTIASFELISEFELELLAKFDLVRYL